MDDSNIIKDKKHDVPLSYTDVVDIVSELDEEEFGYLPLISIFKLAKAIEKFKAEKLLKA